MKREVFVLTTFYHYDDEDQPYVNAYPYSSFENAYIDMLAEFNDQLRDTFNSDPSCVSNDGDNYWELRDGDTYITWAIEPHTVKFDD